jgi:uncharacterized protein YkwD
MEGMRLLLLLLLVSVIQPAAAQRPGQPEIRVADLERRIHDLINRERTSKKLKPLRFDGQLSKIARGHSTDMARRRFFSHVNPDGKDPTDRGMAARYTCRKVYVNYSTAGLAENIYQGNLYNRIRTSGDRKSYDWNTAEDLAKQSVKGWMNSSGHRRNILEKNYTESGVGIAISRDDKVYVTQMFC